jgi:hypothetical protein
VPPLQFLATPNLFVYLQELLDGWPVCALRLLSWRMKTSMLGGPPDPAMRRLDAGHTDKDLHLDTAARRLPLAGARVLRHHPNYKGQCLLVLVRR